jgi:hypothetical protein
VSDVNRYLFEYEYNGEKYGLEVVDETYEAALGRVRRMSTAVYKGELMATVRVPSWMEWVFGRGR